MMLTNYHTHTTFCDGQEAPKRYAEEAIKQSLKALGYSAHAPLPFPCNWTLPYKKYHTYLETIQSLKEKYRNQLEILCGLEIDYIPDLWPQIKTMLNPDQLDFFIGSIHFVDCFEDGTRWSVDGSHEEFYKGWNDIFKQDSHTLVHKYFDYTRQMVREMRPPIIGHLDKIKMQYCKDCFIPDTDPIYRKELMFTLEEIASAGSIVEVNTRGVYKRNELEFYPGQWVLKEMNHLNIPVTINSDAHRPHEITLLHKEAIRQLQLAGYKNIKLIIEKNWVDFNI
jgi:histidinol-phosphatase (PHP family)